MPVPPRRAQHADEPVAAPAGVHKRAQRDGRHRSLRRHRPLRARVLTGVRPAAPAGAAAQAAALCSEPAPWPAHHAVHVWLLDGPEESQICSDNWLRRLEQSVLAQRVKWKAPHPMVNITHRPAAALSLFCESSKKVRPRMLGRLACWAALPLHEPPERAAPGQVTASGGGRRGGRRLCRRQPCQQRLHLGILEPHQLLQLADLGLKDLRGGVGGVGI